MPKRCVAYGCGNQLRVYGGPGGALPPPIANNCHTHRCGNYWPWVQVEVQVFSNIFLLLLLLIWVIPLWLLIVWCLMMTNPEVFSPTESEKSSGDCHESDSEPEPPQMSSSSSGSSIVSSTDPCDPSLPLPINPQARDSNTARTTSTKAGEISINSTQWKT